MEFGRAGAKMCGGCLKVIDWGWRYKSQKRGALFIGNAGSHCVILLYLKIVCENLLQVLLGIYCKRFYWILLFTILLLFCVWGRQSQKFDSKCPNDINTEWAIPGNVSSFLLYPLKFQILNSLPSSPSVCFFPLKCLYCNFWLQPSFWYKHLYPYSLTKIHYCNWNYISEWSSFAIKNFCFFIKEKKS